MNPRNALGASAIVAAIAVVGGLEASKLPDCRHRITTLAGTQVVDPGELNRFPASDAVGEECEPVPCEVAVGEDPDADGASEGECMRRPSSALEKYRRTLKRAEVTP